MDIVPQRSEAVERIAPNDSQSPVAPFRVVNIGNGDKVPLMDFIAAIEKACGRKAVKNFMLMQKGDVPSTWAATRSDEHTFELQSLMRISYSVFSLKKYFQIITITTYIYCLYTSNITPY